MATERRVRNSSNSRRRRQKKTLAQTLLDLMFLGALLILILVLAGRKLIQYEQGLREFHYICYVYTYSKDGEAKISFLTNDNWRETKSLKDSEDALWQIDKFARYKCIERIKDDKNTPKE